MRKRQRIHVRVFCVKVRLTCAGLLVFVEPVSFVAVAGEDTRLGKTDMLTVMLLLRTQVYG